MTATRLRLATWLYFAAFVTTGIAQELPIGKTLAEVRAAWQKWHSARIIGELRIHTTSAGSDFVDALDEKSVVVASDNSLLTSTIDQLRDSGELYYVSNPNYTFEARRLGNQKKFVLLALEPRSSLDAHQSSQVEQTLVDYRPYPSVYLFLVQRWDTVFNSRGFKCHSCRRTEWNGLEAVDLEFEYDPKLHQLPVFDPPMAYFELRKARATLVPSHAWAPVAWSFLAKGPEDTSYVSVTAEASYDFNAKPFPLMTKRVQRRLYEGVEDVETTIVDNSLLGRATNPDEFTLRAFGFNENGEPLPKPSSPRWIWPLIGAIVLLSVGAWYLRRI